MVLVFYQWKLITGFIYIEWIHWFVQLFILRILNHIFFQIKKLENKKLNNKLSILWINFLMKLWKMLKMKGEKNEDEGYDEGYDEEGEKEN